MTNRERKECGLVYRYDDPELTNDQSAYQEMLYEFNHTRPTETKKRQELMKKMFAEIGSGSHVETPVNSNWGCRHVHLGKNIYCNSNVTFVDDAEIFIGDDTLIAPNVVFSTSGHPILPVLREHNYVYNRPVHIGNNVWIGSGVQIMPGVTIGSNSVIGAGSVVTGDIPPDTVAYGVPCKIIRKIGEKDRTYFYKKEKLDVWK